MGTVAGGAGGATLGALIGVWYGHRFSPGGLEELGPFLLGLYVGLWLCSVLGCWAALRLRGHARAGPTAGALGIQLPILVVLATLVWSATNLNPLVVLVAAVALSAVLSRAVVATR